MSERFQKFFEQLLKNEGIYSNDPLDKGGKTIYGISSRSFPQTFNLVYNLYQDGKKELAKAATMNFYRDRFYNTLYDDIKDVNMAFRLFDFGVNAGVKEAVLLLQEAIKLQGGEIDVDGIFGPQTLRVINSSNYYCAYVNRIEKFYTSLNQPRFIRGWLLRLRRRFVNV